MAKNSEDLNNVYSDIQKLLKENPDLDKKLHDLNLQPQFYGEVSNQQIANNTAANTTANSTQ